MLCKHTSLTTGYLPDLSPRELSMAQQMDPCLGLVLSGVKQKQHANSVQSDHPDLKFLKREWDNFFD